MKIFDRKLLRVVAGFVFLVLAVPLHAQDVQWGLGENAEALDPTYENLNWGFRGVAWGTSFEELEESHALDQCWLIGPGVRNCNVGNANLSLGNVPLEHIRFMFSGDTFFAVSLKYAPQYQKDVLQKVIALLGEPTGERDTFPTWDLEYLAVWASDTHFSVTSKRTLGGSVQHSGGTF